MLNNKKKKTYLHTKESDIKTTRFFDNDQMSVSIEESYNSGAFLLRACEKGNIERVKEMLAQGTDPNVRDLADTTGILIASQNGHLEVVKLLLEHKADPNAGLDKNLNTPLMSAIANQHNEIVDALIVAGAKLDVMSKRQVTPIMYAVMVNNITAVEKLLLAGASVEVEGQAVKPIDIAKFKNYVDLVKLLAIHMSLQELKKREPEIHYTAVRVEKGAGSEGAKFKIFALKKKPEDGKEPENTKTLQLNI